MRRLSIALLALALYAPASAGAYTTIIGGSPAAATLYDRWQLDSHIRTAETTVRLDSRDCTEGGGMACTVFYHDGRSPVLVFPDLSYLFGPGFGERDRLMVRGTFLHEMGHVRDYMPRSKRFAYRYRREFARLTGKPFRGWQTCVLIQGGRCVGLDEQFAMAFEWCALDPGAPQMSEATQGYGYQPTIEQHRQVCGLLGRTWR